MAHFLFKGDSHRNYRIQLSHTTMLSPPLPSLLCAPLWVHTLKKNLPLSPRLTPFFSLGPLMLSRYLFYHIHKKGRK